MGSFELGGAVIPIESGYGTVKQTYAPKHTGTILLMGGGNSFKQSLAGAAGKLKTTLSSSSKWAPAPLSSLDYTGQLVLKCAAIREVYGASNVVTLTPKRRTDIGYTPIGYGIVDNEMVSSPVSVNVDEVTVTPVAGATAYVVAYFPEITVFATFDEDLDTGGGSANFGWSLTCEEV